MLALIIRNLICAILFICFIYFFGYKSFKRYKKEETVFVETNVDYDDSKKPIITVWRNLPFDNIIAIEEDCYNKYDNIEETIQCIEKFTFSFHQTILTTELLSQNTNQTLLGGFKSFNPEFTSSFGSLGRKYTILTNF